MCKCFYYFGVVSDGYSILVEKRRRESNGSSNEKRSEKNGCYILGEYGRVEEKN